MRISNQNKALHAKLSSSDNVEKKLNNSVNDSSIKDSNNNIISTQKRLGVFKTSSVLTLYRDLFN